MKLNISQTAFWDTNLTTMDDFNHADFIICRVFQFGLEEDLRAVIKFYNKEQIKHAFEHTRGVDQKAINLARVLGYL